MADEVQPARAGGDDSVKPWALFLGTTVAVATVTVAVTWGLRRLRASRDLADVSDIINECFDRIRQIEGDVRRFRPTAESAN
jgi:hypothetical protein